MKNVIINILKWIAFIFIMFVGPLILMKVLGENEDKYKYIIRQNSNFYKTEKIDSIVGETICFIDKYGRKTSVKGNYTIQEK